MTNARALLQDACDRGATVRVTWPVDPRFGNRPIVVTGVVTKLSTQLAHITTRRTKALAPIDDVTSVEEVEGAVDSCP